MDCATTSHAKTYQAGIIVPLAIVFSNKTTVLTNQTRGNDTHLLVCLHAALLQNRNYILRIFTISLLEVLQHTLHLQNLISSVYEN